MLPAKPQVCKQKLVLGGQVLHMAHGKPDKNNTVALPRLSSMKRRVGMEYDRCLGDIEQDARARPALDRPLHGAGRIFLPNFTVGEVT